MIVGNGPNFAQFESTFSSQQLTQYRTLQKNVRHSQVVSQPNIISESQSPELSPASIQPSQQQVAVKPQQPVSQPVESRVPRGQSMESSAADEGVLDQDSHVSPDDPKDRTFETQALLSADDLEAPEYATRAKKKQQQ